MEPEPAHFIEPDAFTQLRGSGGALPRGLEQRILAMGHAAVPTLMALLDDDALAEDSAGGGWPSIHAVDLLVDLKATEAVDRMVRVLARTSWDDLLHDRILMRLPEFGAAVLEPALGAMVDGIDRTSNTRSVPRWRSLASTTNESIPGSARCSRRT